MVNVSSLSSEDASVILELSDILDIVVAERLPKGHERKFCIQTAQGEKRLLRVNSTEHYDWLEGDFRMYEYVAASGINVMLPVVMGTFREGTLSYQIYTWFDGEDLAEALPRMSSEEQFLAGLKSGALMRRLHTLPPDHEPEPWGTRFGRKVQKIIQSYGKKRGKSQGVDLLVRYLQDHQELLVNRPQTFTHGDWNTENIMLSPDGQIGIVDLSGDKDCGDPWWEFWLIPHDLNSSPHFYTGQIQGYFGGKPPPEFFRMLSYYLAFATLEFLSDSTGEGDTENVKTTLEWFEDIRNPVPMWYFSQIE